MAQPLTPPLHDDDGGTTDRTQADFRTATAAQWRRSALTGEVSSSELVGTALTAAATQAGLGAFLHLDTEFALARAEQQDAVLQQMRRLAGPSWTTTLSRRAPLAGLPTGFKDITAVAGLPLTYGTRSAPALIPPKDSPLARRVHHAGSISIGKTQVPEFGLPCYSENAIGPPARNPLDPQRTAGGSTGGGAAAVASGILPFAPGNDGGGSIRIPAAACGLVGLKPGRGRLPDDDTSSSVRNLATSGPIARTAADAALLFDVMAGHEFQAIEPARPHQPTIALGPAQRGVESALRHGMVPLSVGVTTESPFSPDLQITLAEDAAVALESGISALAGQGHLIQGTGHCTGTEPFWPADYHENFQALWTSRLGEMDIPEPQLQAMEPLTQHFAELASMRSPHRTMEAIEALQEEADAAESIFGPWDVLLTPMLASAAPKVGWFATLPPEQNYIEQCRFTPYSSVVNVLGLPAVNVPVHTSSDGLSWSVQLIGKHGSEVLLLALAATMMRA